MRNIVGGLNSKNSSAIETNPSVYDWTQEIQTWIDGAVAMQ